MEFGGEGQDKWLRPGGFEKLTDEEQSEIASARRQMATGGDFNLQGTPEDVARRIITAYREGWVNGVALWFQDWHAAELRRFGEKVMPLLKEEGIWVHPKDRGYSW